MDAFFPRIIDSKLSKSNRIGSRDGNHQAPNLSFSHAANAVGYVDDVHGVNVIDGTGDPMDLGFYEPPNGPATNPVYHGTFIAGIIGAVGNNGLGIAGLNWSVQIMAIRLYGGDRSRPEWNTTFYSHNLAAFDYVLVMKKRGVNIRVTNHSYSGNVESIAVRDALAALGNEGVLNVCAANNWALNQDLYGSLPAPRMCLIISVAASTETDALWDFSNYGRSTVDLAAPGVDILSTWRDSNYFTGSGTSASCPLVAGAAALLLAVNPNLTVDESEVGAIWLGGPAGLAAWQSRDEWPVECCPRRGISDQCQPSGHCDLRVARREPGTGRRPDPSHVQSSNEPLYR